MEATKKTLNKVKSKTAEQLGLKAGDGISRFFRPNGIDDYIGEGRIQDAISNSKKLLVFVKLSTGSRMHPMTIWICW